MKPLTSRITVIVSVLCLAMTLMASSAFAAEKKKKDPGKKLYMTSTCMACHGRKGQKAIMDYPNLAGQSQAYMIKQINYILKGKRLGSPDATGHPRSRGMVGALTTPEDGKPTISKKQIRLITSWLAKMEPAKIKPPKEPFDPVSVAAGKKLFKKKCKACHGKEGKKPLKGNPYVAGQKRSYLYIQLKDIQSKARKTPKTIGMYNIIKKMSDQQFNSLADYLSQIKR